MKEITDFCGDVIPANRGGASGGRRFIARSAIALRRGNARASRDACFRNCRGVSQRYLAQLENGDANIDRSIVRIAQALDHRIEWLVGADDPRGSETSNRRTLPLRLQRAATKVKEILIAGQPTQLRRGRIGWMGLRGAGKSTWGPGSGGALVPVRGTQPRNRGTERHAGRRRMALYGQEGIGGWSGRRWSGSSRPRDQVVLAVAGGIVTEPETFAFLLAISTRSG